MKRVFAIVVVVLLALGMIGLFFASFLGGASTAQVTAPANVQVQTTPQ